MTTTYITSVTSNGEISSMWTSGAIPSPAEGENPDNPEETIVWVNEDVNNFVGFIETKYYKDNAWADRVARPADHYNWINEEWVLDSELLFTRIRRDRNRKLSACDWTQLPDNNLSDEIKAAWVTHRTILRNIPVDSSGVTHINQVLWPTAP